MGCIVCFFRGLIAELKFWLEHIDAFNGYSIRAVFGVINSVIYTDASDFAFDGYLATLDVLQSYAAKLEGQKVKVFVDNMGVSRILKVSSSKPHLQKVAVDISRLCFAWGISLDSQ